MSVVIATRNRSELLKVGIHSVLNQSFKNFELIIVDDGSTDNTKKVIESFDDPRIVYVEGLGKGISSARNIGAQYSRGLWTAVHDDDDIMLPQRLEEQLKFADDSVDFIYGAFINFDDETAELQLHHGRNYGYGPALMSGFAPGHSTWLVRTELLRRFRYDEGLESAVDNNIAFRMLRSGIRFKHSGVICLLRRVHSGRITDQGGQGQKYVAQMNLSFLKRSFTTQGIANRSKAARRDWGPVDKTNWETRYLEFLPDHLVKRSGYLVAPQQQGEAEINVNYLQVTDVSTMEWAEYFASFNIDKHFRQVSTRVRETAEIERILSNIEVNDLVNKKSARDLISEYALTVVSDEHSEAPTNEKVYVLAIALAEDWKPEQLLITDHRFAATTDEVEVLGGIISLHSLEAAEGIKNEVFSTEGFECRIFVRGTSRTVQEVALSDFTSHSKI